MPATFSRAYTFGRLDPVYDAEDALVQSVNLVAGTYVRGTVLGELTATPGTFKAYATGNSDGSQVAKSLLQYDCVVDGSGNVTIGTVAAGTDWGETFRSAPAYFAGTFRTTDLTGLDAGAVTALGRLVSGVLASGIVRLG